MTIDSQTAREPDGTTESADTASEWSQPLPPILPQPTVWPAVAALGACLIAAGVITSWVISALGALLFALAIGGWISRMRHESAQ